MPPQPNTSVRAVRLAAQDLRKALALPEGERPARVREATQWLISAAEDQGRASEKATELFFSASPEGLPVNQTTGDALAAIIADAQVGNTLIAAGQALQEAGAAPGPAALDRAISSLETTPDFGTQIASALNFSGESTRSANLADATQTLRSRVDETLHTLISEARTAGSQVVEKIAHLDGAKALEALGQLGGPMAKLPQVGELIKKGIEKLQKAVDALLKLLDDAALKAVKEELTAFWSKLTDGTLVDSLLAWAFGRESIQGAVAKVTAIPNLAVAVFDSASDRLPPLGEGFKTKMSWARTLTGVIAAGIGLLMFGGVVAAGPLAVFSAGAYLLILAAILVIGIDYAGAGSVFHEGKGVRGVIESLAS